MADDACPVICSHIRHIRRAARIYLAETLFAFCANAAFAYFANCNQNNTNLITGATITNPKVKMTNHQGLYKSLSALT
ncbi:hypothetical protein M441DRAFT_338055 [Trichoderma asperellum CBS 433.97]|uniref:Uncharacterized protein n=1 Tax=Trichoderma asperellum (strain ATCC 204424 / CBS 433.97 / NBRC 101777) TaxID=1042311 RepID=A0A2T3ZGM4_TRIA4|nr:hypothetical protein M441DRAFT_338055 [Trichoderma asperellum CBS 433.97]PTB43957.1 hypothetical protein M441DRAFT_338055 [Trichoderma asperellum CBS 433.97]